MDEDDTYQTSDSSPNDCPRDQWGTAADADDIIPQPKILLEGTHLTLKTDIAFELAEHYEIIGNREHRWHIPLISAEWQTRSDVQPTKSAPGRSMIDFLSSDAEWAVDLFETYLRLLELNRDYYWIIDRFHISTIAYQQQVYGRNIDLSWVDRRLANLGVVLVHCHRSPESFEAARQYRLTYSENPHNYNNLDVFIREQDLMTELVANSAMPTITVDVSSGDISRIAALIIARTREMGLFFRREP